MSTGQIAAKTTRNSGRTTVFDQLKNVLLLAGMSVATAGCAVDAVVRDCKAENEQVLPQSLCNDLSDEVADKSKDDVQTPPSSDLSVPDLIAYVVKKNPDIALAALAEREQVIGVNMARAARRPQLEVSAGLGPQLIPDLPDNLMTRREASVSFRQTLLDFGVTANDIRRAEESTETARFARLATSEEVAFQTLVTLLDYHRSSQTVALLEEHAKKVSELNDLVRDREENGLANLADVNSLKASLDSAEFDVAVAKSDRDNAADDFFVLTGVAVESVNVSDLNDLLPQGAPGPFDPLTHPAVRAINSEVTALEHQLASKKAEVYPSVGLQATARVNRNVNSGESTDRFGGVSALGITTFSITDGGLRRNQMALLQLRIEEAKVRQEKQLRLLNRDLASVDRLLSTETAKGNLLKSNLSAAQKVVELNEETFRQGNTTVFMVLDGLRQSVAAERALVQHDFDHKAYKLEAAFLRARLVQSILSQR